MTTGRPIFREFATREALAAQLSTEIAALLAEAVKARGAATLAVSGGTTPALFFRALSKEAIDWPRVTITLVDERFVPETSPRSNAGLAKANLLQDAAAAAQFTGLYEDVADAETAALDAADAIRRLGLPLDVVVLGMGGDGHTASFFPDAENLSQLLDPQNASLVSPVHAPSGGEPRLTLTMPPIAGARRIVLHIEGAEKRTVIDAVLAGEDKPIRHVLDHAAVPVQIFWAP
jgi:6-phosphogluconolactonase